MAVDQPIAVVTSVGQAIQDSLAPELRKMRADMRAIRERLEAIHKRFDRLEHPLETLQDVQPLKEQLAELRARQQPSA